MWLDVIHQSTYIILLQMFNNLISILNNNFVINFNLSIFIGQFLFNNKIEPVLVLFYVGF